MLAPDAITTQQRELIVAFHDTLTANTAQNIDFKKRITLGNIQRLNLRSKLSDAATGLSDSKL